MLIAVSCFVNAGFARTRVLEQLMRKTSLILSLLAGLSLSGAAQAAPIDRGDGLLTAIQELTRLWS